MTLHLKFSFDHLPFALTSLSLVSSLACSPCSLSFARNARPFFLFVFDCPLQLHPSRTYPRSHARPARSRSLATLAPSSFSFSILCSSIPLAPSLARMLGLLARSARPFFLLLPTTKCTSWIALLLYFRLYRFFLYLRRFALVTLVIFMRSMISIFWHSTVTYHLPC